jgi:hypothetical protein
MTHNVGTNEQIARLAVGAVTGAAAMGTHGWQRAALCTVSTAAFMTGITRYCPLNAALGRDSDEHHLDRHDEGVRNTEIRRETQTSAAMGQLPGTTVSVLETDR